MKKYQNLTLNYITHEFISDLWIVLDITVATKLKETIKDCQLKFCRPKISCFYTIILKLKMCQKSTDHGNALVEKYQFLIVICLEFK